MSEECKGREYIGCSNSNCRYCNEYRNCLWQEIEQVREEIKREQSELTNMCFALDKKINNTNKTIVSTLILSLIVACIGIALCIGNAVAGCGCQHMEDCKCIRAGLTGWGIASIVLGIVAAGLSAFITIYGVVRDESKTKIKSGEVDNENQAVEIQRSDKFREMYLAIAITANIMCLLFNIVLIGIRL